MLHRSISLSLSITFLLAACLEGGANQGGRQPGNTEGGIDVGLGEIAVSADGRYFLSKSNGYLVVGDLETRSMRALTGLPQADLLAFWPEGAGIYVVSSPETFGSGQPERVLAYDLREDRQLWTRELDRFDTGLDVAPGGRLVLWGLGGVRLLSERTVRKANTIQSRRRDRVVPISMHWRLGYHRAPVVRSLPNAFGHAGFGGSGAWADPDRELAVALVLNSGVGTPFGDLRIVRIGTAAVRCASHRSGNPVRNAGS